MMVRRGDVVLLDYPFSDGSGRKVRPALVVQGDAYNLKLTSTIVALVTKNLSRVGREPTVVLIDLSAPDGRASALTVNSAVTCNNLFTVAERRIIKTLGSVSAALVAQAAGGLKTALGLP